MYACGMCGGAVIGQDYDTDRHERGIGRNTAGAIGSLPAAYCGRGTQE